MNRQFVAATQNPDKLKEFSRLLQPYGIEVLPLKKKNVLESVEEDGETFAQNALIKARAVHKATRLPTIADDSGLCIDALNGRPGVYSARYLGEKTPYEKKMAGILFEMENVPVESRTARFECAIALVAEQGEQVFLGMCEGTIGFEPRGDNGFGYDPLFYVGEKSFAQLTDEQKDAISHRARALSQFQAYIESLV